MKKAILCFGVFSLSVSVFLFSCKKDHIENTSSTAGHAKPMSSKVPANYMSIIKGHFELTDIEENIDISKDAKIMNMLAADNFVSAQKLLPQLDLQHATLYFASKSEVIATVPFMDNGENKVLCLPIKDCLSDAGTALPAMYIENKLDADLNGTSTIYYLEGSMVSTSIKGIIVQQQIMGGKSAFQICMDNCYNDICDGPVGCLAWYTNPQIAIMCIAYCTVKTT